MKRLSQVRDPCPREEGPETMRAAWSRGLVLLCSKCSGQQQGAEGPETMPSWDTWALRCWLKERLSEKGLWPRVRVLTSSCMGICCDGRITCTLGSEAAGGGEPRCLVVDPEQDAEALLEAIEASVSGAP